MAIFDKYKNCRDEADALIKVRPEQYQQMSTDLASAAQDVNDASLIAHFQGAMEELQDSIQEKNQLRLQLIANEAAFSNYLSEYNRLECVVSNAKSLQALSKDERLFARASIALQARQIIREDYIQNLYLFYRAYLYEAFPVTSSRQLIPFTLPDISSIESMSLTRTRIEDEIHHTKLEMSQYAQKMSCDASSLIIFDETSPAVLQFRKQFEKRWYDEEFSLELEISRLMNAFRQIANVKVYSVRMIIGGTARRTDLTDKEEEICTENSVEGSCTTSSSARSFNTRANDTATEQQLDRVVLIAWVVRWLSSRLVTRFVGRLGGRTVSWLCCWFRRRLRTWLVTWKRRWLKCWRIRRLN
jgi:hypothetical protein